MKPTKPGWYWIGILGPDPEVVHVMEYCGDLVYQRAGAIGDQQVKWTIDEIWGGGSNPMKKYKDADGNYLAVDDGANYIRVGWYIPEWGDFGAYIGEKTGKESRILNRLASDFLGIDAMKYNGAFVFDSTRQAKEFLAVANTALINEPMANWPTWAIEAHNAGWTPPKGWTPKRGRK